MGFKQGFELQRKNILTVLLIAVFVWSLFAVTWSDNLFHSGGLATIKQIGAALLQPNLSKEILLLAIE